LHVLSTPPAFVLSQDQTLQNRIILKNLLALKNTSFFVFLLRFLEVTRSRHQSDLTRTSVNQYSVLKVLPSLSFLAIGDFHIIALFESAVNNFFKFLFRSFGSRPVPIRTCRVDRYILYQIKKSFASTFFSFFLFPIQIH
jgi:hypothetical protein